jgi:hypothetical protein
MIGQAFGEHEPYRERETHRDRKKARQVKTKGKSILIIFLDIKRIVHKEFFLAGQTVNSVYYCGL